MRARNLHSLTLLLLGTVSLLAISVPAVAETVNAPDVDGVQLDAVNNTLINNSAISIPDGQGAAVFSSDPVVSILNNFGASITGSNTNSAVFIDNTIGSFANNGTITTNGFEAVGASGLITSFVNTGTITSTDPGGANGVDAQGGFGTFNNSGDITGTQNGVTTGQAPTQFTNSGTIIGQGGNGIGFFNGQGAGTVVNSGTISGLDGAGVDVDGNITSFSNLAGGIITGDNAGNDAAGISVNGTTGTFFNAGSITGEGNAVNFNGNVTSFSNAAGGTLTGGQYAAVRFAQDVNSFSNAGNIFAQAGSPAVNVGGNAGSISNAGTISGGDAGFYLNNGATSFSNSGNISGTFRGVDSNAGLGTFANSGTISSTNDEAVYIGGASSSFTNSGTISSVNSRGIEIDGLVTSFTNSGTVTSQTGRGIYFNDTVASFNNSGTITSFQNGVTFNNGVANFLNTGTIRATDTSGEYGVRIDGLSVITNRGTIEGPEGIHFNNADANVVNNYGTVRGTNGAAVQFAGGDDTLNIFTGSQIFGDVGFAGGTDTFDFSNFYGTTVLYVPGLENVVSGDRAYAFVAADTIAIFDPTGATSIDTVHANSVGAIRNALDQALVGNGEGGEDSELLINGYAAERQPSEAEAATTSVLSDLSVEPNGLTVWGSTFGGISKDSTPVDLSNAYGGIVVGTHATLTSGHTLGGLASYSRSTFNVANGQQVINSDTGILGVYGKSDLGIVTVDYSLLGGAASHSSSRQVVALGVLQTATATFSSWFISPEIGVELPLLSDEGGELNVKATASYVGGAVSAYTETAPGGTVSVGSVGIGVWKGELELNGKRVLGSNDFGDVVLTGKIGLYAQANTGTSNIPISLLGTTVSYTDPGTTAYGVFAGAGVSAPITENMSVNAALNGSVGNDGVAEASASLGIGGDF